MFFQELINNGTNYVIMNNTNMKTYYLKIKDKFISSIREGNKKHEYRLASPERTIIKAGDNLVLISNQDKQKYIRVTVKGSTIYKSWEEALRNNWENDFKNIYSSLDEALKECDNFYKRDDVRKYGIIVFDIVPVTLSFNNASVLLDTNIIIKSESANNSSSEISELFKALDKKGIKKYIHKLSKEELEKYANPSFKKSLIDKLAAYNILSTLSITKDDLFNKVISQYSANENSEIDNALLCEVYNDNVQALITDDNLMLKKAEELYIRDKVLSSNELLRILKDNNPKGIHYNVLNVELKSFADVDLNDDFFNSLREDYGGQDFDQWYKRKANENTQAYVYQDQGVLKGFLYLKVEENEEYEDITPSLPQGKWMKVGTFKIDSTGLRLGERFIKIIFDNAIEQNVDSIYVTLFENKRPAVKKLKEELEEWGFVKYGYNKNGEAVLVKNMHSYDDNKTPKFNFPNIKENNHKYWLPIKPEFHTDLFPDSYLKNEDMNFLKNSKAHQYALEKIYLTGKRRITAKPGDLVLIYRNGEEFFYKSYRSVVTGVAVIQELIETNNVQECIDICKNRSIFSEKQIREIHPKFPTVVKLLYLSSFEHKVTLKYLREKGIIEADGGPRPFSELTESDYHIILEAGQGGEN